MHSNRLARYLVSTVMLVSASAFIISPVVGRPSRKVEAAASCSSWLERTLKSAERVSMLRRRDRILGALDHSACTAIPEVLQKAATRVTAKEGRNNATLAEAARTTLGPACVAAKEATSAWDVVGTCPLSRPEFKIADAALKDMSVTDYLVLNAIQKSLVTTGQYTETAELVLRNFSLSAALLGEQEKERNRKGRVF